MKVRIGFGLGTAWIADTDHFGPLVDDLERLGFDSLWLSEKVTAPAVDPLAGLAFAAGRTHRLKLGTSVLVVPGRNPVLTAKHLASLDVLSGGRLLPAVGLGQADPREQTAFGVRRDERAAWLEEALPLMRRLWSEDHVRSDGPRFPLDDVTVRPRPRQDPIEVWLGARAPSELRRTGRLGDGWLPALCTPEDAAAGRPVVERAAAEAGREIDPEHFGAMVTYAHGEVPARIAERLAARRPGVDPADVVPVGHDALCRQLERFVDVGFSKFVVVPAGDPADWTEELEALGAAVLPLQSR